MKTTELLFITLFAALAAVFAAVFSAQRHPLAGGIIIAVASFVELIAIVAINHRKAVA